MSKCLICRNEAEVTENFYGILTNCPNCGRFKISFNAMEILKRDIFTAAQRKKTSETVREMSQRNSDFILTSIDFGPGKFVDVEI